MSSWIMQNKESSRIPFVMEDLELPLKLKWKQKMSDAVLSQQVANDEAIITCCVNQLSVHDPRTGLLQWSLAPFETTGMVNLFKATPVLYKDRMYGSDTAGNLFCIDVSSGELVWRTREYLTRNDSICLYGDHLFSRCSITQDSIPHNGVASFDLSGNLVWFYSIQNSFVRTRSCSIQDNNLYFGDSECTVHCLDVAYGRRKWIKNLKHLVKGIDIPMKFKRKEISFIGFPMVSAAGVILIIDDRRNIFLLNPESGDIDWQHIVDDDLDFVGSAYHIAADDNALYYTIRNLYRSVELKSGKVSHSIALDNDSLGKPRSTEGIIIGSQLIANYNESKLITVIDILSGNIDLLIECDHGFATSCIWSGSRLFAADDHGFIYCFSTSN